ncbi:hypothetical protein HAX54_047813 [Datura stramonium]|uniref:Uncharacterized protein n=1 Tax=Datura stramonium TaxID=4076 RepID=A0ABS8ST16_DATST|nr:hypothetical protein [Datura stramonium]
MGKIHCLDDIYDRGLPDFFISIAIEDLLTPLLLGRGIRIIGKLQRWITKILDLSNVESWSWSEIFYQLGCKMKNHGFSIGSMPLLTLSIANNLTSRDSPNYVSALLVSKAGACSKERVTALQDHKRMVEVPVKCLINDSTHAAVRVGDPFVYALFLLVLAVKNHQRWLIEKEELELRCEKLESDLASARGQSVFPENLSCRDFEIEVLKTILDEISSDRDAYHKDAHHRFTEMKAMLRRMLGKLS